MFITQMGKKYFFKSSSGQVLLIVIVTMIVALTAGLSIASRTITNLKLSKQNEDSQRAFQAATAGIERYITTGTPAGNAGALSNSSFNTKVATIAKGSLALNNGGLVDQDRGIDLWVSNYPNFAAPSPSLNGATVTIYWGTADQVTVGDHCSTGASKPSPALEVLLLSNPASPTLTKYLYDPCASRRSGNQFTAPLTMLPSMPTSITKIKKNGAVSKAPKALDTLSKFFTPGIAYAACTSGYSSIIYTGENCGGNSWSGHFGANYTCYDGFSSGVSYGSCQNDTSLQTDAVNGCGAHQVCTTPTPTPTITPTPTPTSVYKVTWGATNTPTTMTVGTTVSAAISFTNSGTLTWLNSGTNPVDFSYHWYNGFCPYTETNISAPWTNTNIYGAWDRPRTSLPSSVSQGGTVTNLSINTLTAPTSAGTYCLVYDLVQEGLTWFISQGSPVSQRTVTVSSAPTPTPTPTPIATPTPTSAPGPWVVDGITFYYKTPPITLNNALVMKVIPLYASSRLGAVISGGNTFPPQGKVIESLGSSGETKRKVLYYESYPQIPNEIFPYSVLSQ